jgi:hypothetical protein
METSEVQFDFVSIKPRSPRDARPPQSDKGWRLRLVSPALRKFRAIKSGSGLHLLGGSAEVPM